MGSIKRKKYLDCLKRDILDSSTNDKMNNHALTNLWWSYNKCLIIKLMTLNFTTFYFYNFIDICTSNNVS